MPMRVLDVPWHRKCPSSSAQMQLKRNCNNQHIVGYTHVASMHMFGGFSLVQFEPSMHMFQDGGGGGGGGGRGDGGLPPL